MSLPPLTSTAVTAHVPGAGAVAPDFSLENTARQTVTLSEFRGKQPVLLAFFPLAFTGTCTAELCDMSEDYDAFAQSGVAILPISVDATPSLNEFKNKYSMKTELVSDFKRQAGDAYGVMFGDTFFTNRAYFLIDKDGIVRWSHVEAALSDKRTNAEILAEIAKL